MAEHFNKLLLQAAQEQFKPGTRVQWLTTSGSSYGGIVSESGPVISCVEDVIKVPVLLDNVRRPGPEFCYAHQLTIIQ